MGYPRQRHVHGSTRLSPLRRVRPKKLIYDAAATHHNSDVVADVVDVPVSAEAEERGEDATADHPHEQVIAQVHALCYVPTAEIFFMSVFNCIPFRILFLEHPRRDRGRLFHFMCVVFCAGRVS